MRRKIELWGEGVEIRREKNGNREENVRIDKGGKGKGEKKKEN